MKSSGKNREIATMDIQHALIELIQKADRQSANLLLDNWADEHGYDRLLNEVLEPTLLLIVQELIVTTDHTHIQVIVLGINSYFTIL